MNSFLPDNAILEHNNKKAIRYGLLADWIDKKHPELKEMILTDPFVRAWLETWIRSDKSIEDGLAELALHLYKAKKQATMELFKGEIEMGMKSRMVLSNEQIKRIYNGDVFKLCGRCSSKRGWERIGEIFEKDFCQQCNQPALLYYVE